MAQAEENNKDLERNTLFGNSEFEKEKALLTQRITYFEKSLEESGKKEKDLLNEIKT
jgi:hypothetical protein